MSDAAAAVRAEVFDTAPADDGTWTPLTRALDREWVEARVARLAEGDGHGPRKRSVAGAYFGGNLAWQVATAAAAVLHAEQRALDVSLDNLAVRIGADGWPSRLAVLEEQFTVLPDDPLAGTEGVVVVDDRAALVATLADGIVASMEPVLRLVREVSRYGRGGLWGAVADHVANLAWTLDERGAAAEELDAAWATAEELLDALQARQPWLKVRPRRFTIARPGGPVQLPMRGTCCLYYLTPEAAAAEGDGLCTTCPRRTDPERIALVERFFSGRGEAAR